MEKYKKLDLWIYPVTNSSLQQILEFKQNYICSIENPDCKKGSILFLYLKNKKKSGFVGYFELYSPFKKNIDIKIFRDDRLNKYTAEFKFKKIFDKPIRADLLLTIKEYRRFTYLYTNDENKINLVSELRDNFLKLFSDQSNLKIIPDIKQIEPNKKIIPDGKQKKSAKLESDPDSKKEIFPIKIKTTEPTKKIIKIDTEDSTSDIDNQPDIESASEEDEHGFIPILIIPCDNFNLNILPSEGKKKYFIEHYKTCNNCDIINNNSIELTTIFDSAKIEFITIKEQDNALLEIPLNYYYSLKKYDPADSKSQKFIRVAYINNSHELYNKCYLVTWCNKKEEIII